MLPGALFPRRCAGADRPDLSVRDTVIVFARAPRLGTVKRRLGRELGARVALRFHCATLTGLLRGLVAERRFRTVLAVTPGQAKFPLPVLVARVGQGAGDLGQRMDRACRRYRRGRVAVIGADIPDAGPADLRAAFRILGTADIVFGPAADG
ncbi:MAG: TIGR04282 family arsenosugar biosynthesis glycosyltransferase, partial [Acetobacteraceae bacterium]